MQSCWRVPLNFRNWNTQVPHLPWQQFGMPCVSVTWQPMISEVARTQRHLDQHEITTGKQNHPPPPISQNLQTRNQGDILGSTWDKYSVIIRDLWIWKIELPGFLPECLLFQRPQGWSHRWSANGSPLLFLQIKFYQKPFVDLLSVADFTLPQLSFSNRDHMAHDTDIFTV